MNQRHHMMTLYRGKFYKNGDAVPTEIGNKEQIEIMERAETLREGILGCDGEFTCLCGQTFTNPVKSFICKCGLRFTITPSDDYPGMFELTLK